ncbi:hypothetical protein [Halomonas sp. 15WGF]|jgi:hypothetical protein|uniref:hypothetical protein n=1 Tax=Halomonas sp. 15WGF TaxID=2570357 RepID=UPI0010BE8E95|nr:hypothetical protein [Halomonas sp. 15WGF]TKJ09848.1 hypothetical protein E8Q34_14455 [Halomonas sp. 15WGF]
MHWNTIYYNAYRIDVEGVNTPVELLLGRRYQFRRTFHPVDRAWMLTFSGVDSHRHRRITVHLGAAADKWWPTLLKGLPKLTALS